MHRQFQETIDHIVAGCLELSKTEQRAFDPRTKTKTSTKEVLYEVRCLKSNEDMILALAGQFKQLSHEPEKFR